MDLIGQTIGQYKITGQIGKGGMAAVYRAYQPSLDRQIALKVLLPQLTADATFIERFLQEARAAAKMNHANIVHVYDVAEVNGLYYIAMAYIEGASLADILQQGAMPPVRAAHIINQIAGALDYAHGRGIIHRDIKPGNILVAAGDQAWLTDFGIAKAAQQSSGLTRAGTMVGTPAYMAPEQAKGQPVTPQTDQYALAVVAYEALTGHPPFQADTSQAILYQHVHQPPDLSMLPLPYQSVLQRALAKKSGQRFTSVSEFGRSLQNALKGQFVSATPYSKPQTKVNQSFWLWVGGAIIIGLILLVVFMAGSKSAPEISRVASPTLIPKTATSIPTSKPPSATPTPTPLPTETPTLARADTPTLAATATAIPLDDLLFQDSQIDAASWVVGPLDQGDFISYSRDGLYHFDWFDSNGATWDLPDETIYRDFAVEARGELVAGDKDHSYGLIFRMVDEHNYYTAEISEDFFSIGKQEDGEWDFLLEWEQSPALIDGGPNHLQVVASGAKIDLYANNMHVGSVVDGTFKQGKVGIYASGLKGNHVALHDFKLWSLPGQTATVKVSTPIPAATPISTSTPTPKPPPKPTAVSAQVAEATLNKGPDSIYLFGEGVEFCFRLAIPARAKAIAHEGNSGQDIVLGQWDSLGPAGACVSGPMAIRGNCYILLEAYGSRGEITASDLVRFRVDR
ncbi:MAG: serine/threonine protein kinase [Anaerolineae bacterium]|nr:serine/threonine protein kinase [Anaerolineae bacterium]